MKKQTDVIRIVSEQTAQMEHSEALFLTSSYTFNNAAQAYARFNGDEPGNVYGRFSNPNEQTFSRRLAALEGVKFGIATATGMGAITTLVLAHLKSGDHIVAANCLFGTTYSIFNQLCAQFGIECTFVSMTDINQWRNAMQPNTKMVFCETPSNPTNQLIDLAAVGQVAKTGNALFVVDNCLATAVLQQPNKYGADIIMHSATKMIDGQGRCLGGALLCNDAELHNKHFATVRMTGITISPFNAWVLSKSLETLKLRVLAQSNTALEMAKWLQTKPQIKQVHYCGLTNHPQYALCQRQQAGIGGTLIAFEIDGDRQTAWQIIDQCKMISISTNLGDTKSIICHPATTSHLRLTNEQRQAAGINESLIRLSIGLEDIEDIKTDLSLGLDSIT